jgi:methylmalonyl-CoA mutase C-terminal domain/subunit
MVKARTTPANKKVSSGARTRRVRVIKPAVSRSPVRAGNEAPKKLVQSKSSMRQTPAQATAAGLRIKVLIAKVGLDGHDRGAKVVARALRDAGMEVVYSGLHQTPEMIVRSAIQEDVHCIGLSILSGAHMTLFPAILRLLKKQSIKNIIVFGGGIIPAPDVAALKKLGVREIFLPGSATTEIIDWLRLTVQPRGAEI